MKETGDLLGSTTSDENGDYVLLLVGTPEHEENIQQKIAYPNPFNDKVNVVMNSEKNDNYSLRVFDVAGREIFSKDVFLGAGENVISLDDLGSQGLKLISLSNGTENNVYKAVHAKSSALSPRIEVVNKPLVKGYKSLEALTDSILLTYASNGYETWDTTVAWGNHIVDYVLQQIPDTFNVLLKPFLESGEPVTVLKPDFSVTIDWADGTSDNYPVVNGEINIQKEIYTLNGELGTALIKNDTMDYNGNGVLSWSIGRLPNQKTNRANLYQNECVNVLLPDYETLISLDSLNNKVVHHYTVRKWVEGNNNEWYRMDGYPAANLVSSTGIYKTSSYIEIPPEVADSVDLVVFSFNQTTGNPVAQEHLDRLLVQRDQIMGIYNLENGDSLFAPFRTYVIDSYDDPRWQAIIDRGFENFIYLTYYSGPQENTRHWADTYTYNGEARLKYSDARFNTGNNNAVVGVECYSAITGIEEGTGALAPYVYDSEAVIIPLGKAMPRLAILLDLGTD